MCRFEYLSSLGTEISFLQEAPPVPYPIHAIDLDASALDELPSGFRHLIHGAKLSRNVIEVIQRANIVNDATFGKSKTTPNYNTYKLEITAKYFDYIEACPELGSPDDPWSEAPLGKLLCLALLVYCCNDLCPVSALSASKTSARRGLTAELLKCTSTHDEKCEEECLLWVWIVALNAWRNNLGVWTGVGSELSILFKARFRLILGGGYEGCSYIVESFLWNPSLDITLLAALA
ncbi:hypothetical protein G647_07370 [Cladophialophora carrionii CBS 160.54]|uniref:Uncharacterized protein n=1 Tax=Cladophialophora carrionii CBS 160.54 TaxID=1279043 RepID=V9D4U8_9EURO|nr:uncharacterized protein G647_07370 [Cladophialophora carrionii CBS 160.54]ETI21027.1 hypothetical protein G647_07370 [Cladophialophora carrionii CBS 160.54]